MDLNLKTNTCLHFERTNRLEHWLAVQFDQSRRRWLGEREQIISTTYIMSVFCFNLHHKIKERERESVLSRGRAYEIRWVQLCAETRRVMWEISIVSKIREKTLEEIDFLS